MKSEYQLRSLGGVICIDPGVHTAVVGWSHDLRLPAFEKCVTAQQAATYVAPERMNQCSAMSALVKEIINSEIAARSFVVKMIFVEGVAVYANSGRSMVSATSGDLSNLSYLVGAITSALELEDFPVKIIPPSAWKGQLDDTALRLRIERCGLSKPKNSHIAAAIGMGLSLRGWL